MPSNSGVRVDFECSNFRCFKKYPASVDIIIPGRGGIWRYDAFEACPDCRTENHAAIEYDKGTITVKRQD